MGALQENDLIVAFGRRGRTVEAGFGGAHEAPSRRPDKDGPSRAPGGADVRRRT